MSSWQPDDVVLHPLLCLGFMLSIALHCESRTPYLCHSIADYSCTCSGQSETGSKKVTVEFQADFNTVDVRGQQSQQALVDIERAIGSMPAGSAMFVVHGVATGRLRSEIHQYLSRNAQVDRFVLDRDSAGGCTIVHLRQ